MLDQATFHMCGLEVDIMRLTEMILKVAQNYTMDTVKQSTAFWFPVLVALMDTNGTNVQ